MTAVQVVLIEDNLGDAVLVEEIIGSMGIECELKWFNDGQKALDYFSQGGGADFILLDLKLPRMNGHEVMRSLKDRGVLERSSLVVMTGSTMPRDLERSQEVTGAGYLIKPMGIEEMEEVTRKLRKIFMREGDDHRRDRP